jgi:uncharacterized membrane protein
MRTGFLEHSYLYRHAHSWGDDPGGRSSLSLVHWKKVAEALFSDSSFVSAGKRLLLRILRSQHLHVHVQQRGFCRLPRGNLTRLVILNTPFCLRQRPGMGLRRAPARLLCDRLKHIPSLRRTVPRYIPLLPALCYPLTAHFAAARHSVSLTLLAIGLLAAAVLLPAMLRGRLAAWLAFSLVLAGLWLLRGLHMSTLPLYVAPVLIPAFVAWVFGHTLAQDKIPLIERLVRVLHPPEEPLDPGIQPYARALTLTWTLLLISIATLNLVLAAVVAPEGLLLAAGVAPPFTVAQRTWSLFANAIGYLLLAGFFLLEYAYRRRRFPQQPYRNLFDFIRRMAAATPQLMKFER